MTPARRPAERPEEEAHTTGEPSPRETEPAGRPPVEADGPANAEAVEDAGVAEAPVDGAVTDAAQVDDPTLEPERTDAEATDDGEVVHAERQRDEYLALAQRTQADFENYRRRMAKEQAAAGARAKAALLRELLPVVDNLERALASAEEAEQGLAHGVGLVLAELVGALERSGIESFEPAGEPFDPTVHEALSTRAEDGSEVGVVLDVVEKGYRLDGTVLRPARVVVSA